MTDRQHEHNPATDPPGAQSDQNREDAQSGHRDDETHPEPRTSGSPAQSERGESSTSGKQPEDPAPSEPRKDAD